MGNWIGWKKVILLLSGLIIISGDYHLLIPVAGLWKVVDLLDKHL